MISIWRCGKKVYRSIVILSFLVTFISINVLLNRKSSSSLKNLLSIQPFDQSLLFPINGTVTCLGRACSIYIINLPARTDRRTESIAVMQALNLEAIIVPAYSIYSPEIRTLNDNRRLFFFKSSELACWVSHMRVWITIANRTLPQDDTWTLIFEDDIDLEMDTPFIMQSFPYSIWNDADLIYLGHCANPPGKLIFQSSEHMHRVYQARHPSCTHAYAIRSSTARQLVSHLSEPSRPIDDSIIALIRQRQLVAYSIHPPLAIQKLVSNRNPSDVNPINRDSLLYWIQSTIYTFLQWLNGVQPYKRLNKSALSRANFTRAKHWRRLYEKDTWGNRV